MANIVQAIIWFLILIFIAIFLVAPICASLYILIHPLSVCIEPLTGISDALLQGIQFPHYCAKKMVE